MRHLKKLRADKRLTLHDVAKFVDCNASNISRIERGLQRMTLDTAKKLSELYQVSIDYIVNGDNSIESGEAA